MKKIELVTWIGGGNYGTSLQSFSLHRKLEDLGYETSIVIPFIPTKFNLKSILAGVLMLWGLNVDKIKMLVKGTKSSIKQQKFDKFEEKYYNKKIICFPFQLYFLNKNTDVYVSGSDQIWNTAYRFDPFYFLDFAANVKRVAYASSMGIDDFPEEHKVEVKRMLLRFAKIGVREETAVKAISKLLNRNDVSQVLDPTFLLSKKEWLTLSEDAEIEDLLPEKYIFCYFIGNNPWYVQQVEKVKMETGIQNVVQVCLDEENGVVLSDGANIYRNAGPLEFIRLIKDSSLVCTDSFHATAISINLEQSFVEFMRFSDSDKSSQNSRIYDVLNHYGMSSRIYNNDNTNWALPIDYSSITQKLNYDREKSIHFLINAIEK